MSNKTKYFFGTLLLLSLYFAYEWHSEAQFRNSESVAISFLNVGQGDATLIRDSEGKTILIDAGPGDRVMEALARRLPAWERTIDVLILTHLDADHITGATDVIRHFRVGEIWWNGATATTKGSRRLLSEIHAKHLPMKVVQSGEVYDMAHIRLTVIHPDRNLSGVFLTDTNAESVSVRLDCGDDVALLAGDAPIETEMDFLADGDIADITLLKVSHHGSKNSTSGTFLDAVTPEYALISSGKGNRYGHPAYRVLTDLWKRNIKIFRTDEGGDIEFLCDGTRLTPLLGS